MEAEQAPGLPDLPAGCLELVVRCLNIKERVRLFCTSSVLYKLSRQPGAPFFDSVRLQLFGTAQRASVAAWLAGLRQHIQTLVLYEQSATDSQGDWLQPLAGGALTSLEWGLCQPGHFAVFLPQLPSLRRLLLTLSQSSGRDPLTFTSQFSVQLPALQELRIDAIFTNVTLFPGCLPPSLTCLDMGPSMGCGYLPDAVAAATQLRQLRVTIPQPAGSRTQQLRISRLQQLTSLEVYHAGRLYNDLAALTALEKLTLWAPCVVIDGPQLEVALLPLKRLTSLSLWEARFDGFTLPFELGALTTLEELVVLVIRDGLYNPDVMLQGLEVLGRLMRLTKLTLRGTGPSGLPKQLFCLPEQLIGIADVA